MWSVKDTRILPLVSSGQFYFTFRSIRSILTGNSFLNLSRPQARDLAIRLCLFAFLSLSDSFYVSLYLSVFLLLHVYVFLCVIASLSISMSLHAH